MYHVEVVGIFRWDAKLDVYTDADVDVPGTETFFIIEAYSKLTRSPDGWPVFLVTDGTRFWQTWCLFDDEPKHFRNKMRDFQFVDVTAEDMELIQRRIREWLE